MGNGDEVHGSTVTTVGTGLCRTVLPCMGMDANALGNTAVKTLNLTVFDKYSGHSRKINNAI